MEVTAGEYTGVLHRVYALSVCYYVARSTASAAEQYARSNGSTDADIEAARRCIELESTQSASAQLVR
jgi:hypothetical protein